MKVNNLENNITICKANTNNAKQIAAIGTITFKEAYFPAYSLKYINAYCKKNYTDKIIKNQLLQVNITYFIAFFNNTPVGFAQIRQTNLLSTKINIPSIELGRIYLLKQYTGLEIGKQLLNACQLEAINKKYLSIWLQVWQQNKKAINFYLKNGFSIIDTCCFENSGIDNEDFIMQKILC